MGTSVSPCPLAVQNSSCFSILSMLTPTTRGLHSSTFRLNISASSGTGAACRGYLGDVWEVSGGVWWCLGCVFVSEAAQVELKSGRV